MKMTAHKILFHSLLGLLLGISLVSCKDDDGINGYAPIKPIGGYNSSKEIAPGVTETIYFTFPRPSSPTATLKIFTVEYDIEGY